MKIRVRAIALALNGLPRRILISEGAELNQDLQKTQLDELCHSLET